jgi:hypothetical protein
MLTEKLACIYSAIDKGLINVSELIALMICNIDDRARVQQAREIWAV